MQDIHQGKAGKGAATRLAGALGVAACLAAAVGGCGTSIGTPLPDVGPIAPTSLTQAERAKAVEELDRKRATHEQDAQQQIEQSR
jgi:hypothetical protein